jgi:integrase
MTATVRELLTQCILRKTPDDYVFTRDRGEPIRDFRAAWGNACCAAGVGKRLCRRCGQIVTPAWYCASCGKKRALRELKYVGLLFHDLRRTGARNLRRAGVAEGVIQKIGGWKTRSVFERYAIVDQRDIADAMQKLEVEQALAKLKTTQETQFGQVFGQGALETRSGAIPHALPSTTSNYLS